MEEVFTAGDVGDVLGGVVDDDGEVVGGADVFAGEDEVAEEVGINGDGAVNLVGKGERADEGCRFSGVETPGRFRVGWGRFEAAAGPGVERALGTVGGVGKMGEFAFDFAAGAVAGVEEVERFEMIESGLIVREAVELSPGFAVPREAKVAKVVEDGFVVMRSDAGVVDVFEAKQKFPLMGPGKVVGDAGGVGVAEVEESGGAGGEAGHSHVGVKKVLADFWVVVYLSSEHEEKGDCGGRRSRWFVGSDDFGPPWL